MHLHPQKHVTIAIQLVLFAIVYAYTVAIPAAQLHVIDCNPKQPARLGNLVWLQDQEDLDEAREISAHNRRMRSGEVRDLESDLKDNLHTMEVCVLWSCDRPRTVRRCQVCIQPDAHCLMPAA